MLSWIIFQIFHTRHQKVYPRGHGNLTWKTNLCDKNHALSLFCSQLSASLAAALGAAQTGPSGLHPRSLRHCLECSASLAHSDAHGDLHTRMMPLATPGVGQGPGSCTGLSAPRHQHQQILGVMNKKLRLLEKKKGKPDDSRSE